MLNTIDQYKKKGQSPHSEINNNNDDDKITNKKYLVIDKF